MPRAKELELKKQYGCWVVQRLAWTTKRHRYYAVISACCGGESSKSVHWILECAEAGKTSCGRCGQTKAKDSARKVEAS